MTESDRRLLTEYLGEEPPYVKCIAKDEQKYPCPAKYCSECKYMVAEYRTFTTIQDFYDLKKNLVEKGEWKEFWIYAVGEHTKDRWCDTIQLFDWLINPDRCETVASWLRGRKER